MKSLITIRSYSGAQKFGTKHDFYLLLRYSSLAGLVRTNGRRIFNRSRMNSLHLSPACTVKKDFKAVLYYQVDRFRTIEDPLAMIRVLI